MTYFLGSMSEGRRVPAVTVFGWDDVLCPTTQAKIDRGRHNTQDFAVATTRGKSRRKELLVVGASVVRCIQAAQRHGPVVIVTESDEDWVRGTAKLLLPGAWDSCIEGVEIVSSRERFGGDFPTQPVCWNIAAFSYITNRHLLAETSSAGLETEEERDHGERVNDSRGGSGGDDSDEDNLTRDQKKDGGTGGYEGGDPARNISCAARGVTKDTRSGGGWRRGTLVAVTTAPRAWQDKSATRTLREHHPEIVTKTVSLIESPTPLELKNQLDLLSENFELMFGHRESQSAPVSTMRYSAGSLSPSSSPSPSVPDSPFLWKPRHYMPGGGSVLGGEEFCVEDYATPTTISSSSTARSSFDDGPYRYFDDNATVISSSSENSADDEEDAFPEEEEENDEETVGW